MNNDKELIYNETMQWWQEIHEEWKSVFFYNYLQKRAPDLLSKLLWESKEVAGGLVHGAIECFLNFQKLMQAFPYPEYFVALESKSTKHLVDFSFDAVYQYDWQGNTYKVTWPMQPETSGGIRSLEGLETLHLYKQYNDEAKQLKINIDDFTHLLNLKELHLHISHCDILEPLLALNLPALKSITFYTGINHQSYNYSHQEETYLGFMKSASKVSIGVSCYID